MHAPAYFSTGCLEHLAVELHFVSVCLALMVTRGLEERSTAIALYQHHGSAGDDATSRADTNHNLQQCCLCRSLRLRRWCKVSRHQSSPRTDRRSLRPSVQCCTILKSVGSPVTIITAAQTYQTRALPINVKLVKMVEEPTAAGIDGALSVLETHYIVDGDLLACTCAWEIEEAVRRKDLREPV